MKLIMSISACSATDYARPLDVLLNQLRLATTCETVATHKIKITAITAVFPLVVFLLFLIIFHGKLYEYKTVYMMILPQSRAQWTMNKFHICSDRSAHTFKISLDSITTSVFDIDNEHLLSFVRSWTFQMTTVLRIVQVGSMSTRSKNVDYKSRAGSFIGVRCTIGQKIRPSLSDIYPSWYESSITPKMRSEMVQLQNIRVFHVRDLGDR